MRRILILTQEYPPRTGGAGVVAHQNAEALATLGYEITVLTRAWGDSTDSRSGVRVESVAGLRAFWPFYMAKKLKELDPNSFDGIILNDVGAAFVFSTFFPFEKVSHKCLLYLHGDEVHGVLQCPRGYLKWTRFLGRYVRLIESCKGVVAVSDYMKRYFVEHFPVQLDEDKVFVVYAGVDEKLFRPVPSQIRCELEIGPEEAMLISVGRIVREKGFSKMLGVFEKAWSQDPSLHWVIIGDGPFGPEFRQDVGSRAAGQNIHLLGRIAREKLPQYYSAADVFWLLSERESFGLVYVEAQMCGCPAIGTAKHGALEAISHGVSGFLVRNEEECLDVFSGKMFRHLNKALIEDFAHKFSLNAQLKMLENLL